MTREEIIAGLQFTIDMFLFDPSTGERITEPRNDMDKITIDACKGAIELLEQQLYEDCISRQAAIEVAKQYWYKSDITGALAELPPVQPKPKTGHWIMPRNDDGMSDPIEYQVRCSECGFDLDPQTWYMELHEQGGDKYCPYCGVGMIEPQESEVRK